MVNNNAMAIPYSDKGVLARYASDQLLEVSYGDDFIINWDTETRITVKLDDKYKGKVSAYSLRKGGILSPPLFIIIIILFFFGGGVRVPRFVGMVSVGLP